ncbi:MAG: GNAT family N-acetyltransferase [Bdellovibrionota bacterium]
MNECGLELHDLPNSPEAAAIQQGIKEHNAPFRTSAWRELTVFARGADGTVTAGLNGYTDWDWLFVKLLWVDQAERGKGFGARLLAAAEAEARTRGCRSVWLDTFSFQARGFYERRGYGAFAELEDYPRGHSRIFLRKALY